MPSVSSNFASSAEMRVPTIRIDWSVYGISAD